MPNQKNPLAKNTLKYFKMTVLTPKHKPITNSARHQPSLNTERLLTT